MKLLHKVAPLAAAMLLSLIVPATARDQGDDSPSSTESRSQPQGWTPTDDSRSSAERQPVRAPPLVRVRKSRILMGVPFHITVYAVDQAIAITAIDDAFDRIEQLNDIFSDYQHDSEVRRLTEEIIPGKPIPISDDMRELLRRSLDVSQRSHGAFDVTVSPVVKLWRRARRREKKPSPEEIQQTLARVGWQKLTLDLEKSTIAFAKQGMALDFGGIAKGFACDEALEVLASQGITQALVNASGDMVCGGAPPGKPGWLIAIEPRGPQNEKKTARRRILVLENQSVATSGDTYGFVEFDGVRYSHIVDPQTGLGLTTPSSVTVIAPDGTRADALATAVSVMAPQAGLRFVENTEGVEALVVWLDEAGQPHRARSEHFAEYFGDQ